MAVSAARARQEASSLWWLWLIRSIVLVLFGLFAAIWPGLTLILLSAAFAIWLIVVGIADLVHGVTGFGKRSLWFLQLLGGVLEVGLGVYLLKNELLTLSVFIAVVGIALIVKAVIEFVGAFERGYTAGQKFLLISIAVITAIAGVAVLLHPISGGLVFTWALGVYGIVAGAIGIALAINARDELDA